MASLLWNNGWSLILKPCGKADVPAKTVHTVRFLDIVQNVRIIDWASRTDLGLLSTAVPHPKPPFLIRLTRRPLPSSIPLCQTRQENLSLRKCALCILCVPECIACFRQSYKRSLILRHGNLRGHGFWLAALDEDSPLPALSQLIISKDTSYVQLLASSGELTFMASRSLQESLPIIIAVEIQVRCIARSSTSSLTEHGIIFLCRGGGAVATGKLIKPPCCCPETSSEMM